MSTYTRDFIVEGTGQQVHIRQVREDWFVGFSDAFPGLLFVRRHVPALLDVVAVHLAALRGCEFKAPEVG